MIRSMPGNYRVRLRNGAFDLLSKKSSAEVMALLFLLSSRVTPQPGWGRSIRNSRGGSCSALSG